jgi:DNA-binding MarR family transcriptional regulator
VSSPHSRRDELIAAILRATADVAARRTAHGQAVAERLGLASADVEVLTALSVEGAMTVGRIGELTGLTTGATTRMVDRLEQAGFVRRVPDPGDRRRVIVEPAGDRGSAVVRAFDPIELAARQALAELDEPVLEGIAGYLSAFAAAISDASSPASSDAEGPADVADVGAPIASATSGRLVFVTGAPMVKVSAAADLGSELYKARFKGAIPSARVRDGVITIRFPRLAWFDWRKRIAGEWVSASAHWRRNTTEIVLNASLPWTIELRGGATSLSADMRTVRLGMLDVAGGAGIVELALGRPSGVVPVRIAGSVGDVRVSRPADVPVVLTVAGGYRSAHLDGVEAWSPGRITSRGAETAADRFEIQIAGGANNVDVKVA